MTVNYYCRSFRIEVLNKTLNDLSFLTGQQIGTISAFEHGRSNNLNHLKGYLLACENDHQKALFLEGLSNNLLEVKNEGF